MRQYYETGDDFFIADYAEYGVRFDTVTRAELRLCIAGLEREIAGQNNTRQTGNRMLLFEQLGVSSN